MKRALLALLLSGIFVITMQGQYVTIEGRQFKDENGEDFYPVVLNYQAEIIHDDVGHYFIAPSGAYGPTWGTYDCDSISICNHEAFVQGSTQDQKRFADTAIQMKRNCGASGISWWQYQDTWWGLEPNVSNSSDYMESFFGLLNPAKWDSSTGFSAFRKPAVETFRAFDPNEPPGTFPTPSELYYNPYYFSEEDSNTRIGYVFDSQTNLPIKDAVVLLCSKVFLDPYLIDDDYIQLYYHHTYTTESGVYHAHPPPKCKQPSKIDDIKISCPGCERIERGWTSNYNPDSIPIYPDTTLFYLSKQVIKFADTIQDVLISGGLSRTYKGWNSVAAYDFLVQSGGEGEISARNEVTLFPDFEVSYGGKFYSFTEIIFPKCPDFSGLLKARTSNITTTAPADQEIELSFTPEKDPMDFELFPNPNNGKFTIKFNQSIYEKWIINTIDITGRIRFTTLVSQEDMCLDMSGLENGVYIVQICSENKIIQKKLVLNK